MAIRMMCREDEFLNDVEGVEVVHNYSGHETGRFVHDTEYGEKVVECPNKSLRVSPVDIHFVKPETCLKGCGRRGPLFMKTTHKGLVLSLGEKNGYDDSDFYAKVWNAEKGHTESITYATTRGWTYPNGASVDATEEVIAVAAAAAKIALEKRNAAIARVKAGNDARRPDKGKLVKFVRGRKVPKGTVARIAWIGPNRFWRDPDRYNKNPYSGMLDAYREEDLHKFCIGIKIDGKMVFSNAHNVEIIEEENA